MEKLPLEKSIRISQRLIGTFVFVHFLLNMIMNIFNSNLFQRVFSGNPEAFDIAFLFIYFGEAIGGINLLMKKNWGIYPVLILISADLIIMFYIGFVFLIIYDIVIIVLCVQFFMNLKKLRDEELYGGVSNSLILDRI